MKIRIDCDGVLADFHKKYISILNMLMGTSWRYEDFTSFEFEDIVGEEADDWVWRYIDATPGFVRGLEDFPGAVEGLGKLRAMMPRGSKLTCLTSPHVGPYWMYERYLWLFDRGFKKREIGMASDKGDANGLLLVDDKYQNCKEFVEANKGALAFLMDAPYNQNKHHPNIIRCRGWGEVVQKVEAILL